MTTASFLPTGASQHETLNLVALYPVGSVIVFLAVMAFSASVGAAKHMVPTAIYAAIFWPIYLIGLSCAFAVGWVLKLLFPDREKPS